MGDYNFSQRQCIHALLAAGFYDCSSRGGKHFKFCAPDHIEKGAKNQRPFIMVPRHADLHAQHAIIRELKRMGGDALLKSFLENL